MPWILLCPLYITLCLSPGLEIALTVPSMNPKQLSKAAPLAEIASAYICKATGFKIPLFQLVTLWWWVSYIYSITLLVIMHRTGTGLPKR